MSDLYINQIGQVMVIAPNPNGQLHRLAETKQVAFYNEADVKDGLTRWIFADFPKQTLTDQWGNHYDHQVHHLISGSLSDGRTFLELLAEAGLLAEEASDLFVPFQKLDIHSEQSSDNFRQEHPRAFALAKRAKVSILALVTDIRDQSFIGQ